ncbi:hypothetical protein GCM10017772_19780 [Promicromonospora soli]|uniref:Uncharacterized protein n=1 Tax=Promicromonospora soli TaxID=2035533 RepID=A0A919KSY1_9MICO|nr:hypothetical protein GCM10017772_19780 [Promicromonospora soli]
MSPNLSRDRLSDSTNGGAVVQRPGRRGDPGTHRALPGALTGGPSPGPFRARAGQRQDAATFRNASFASGSPMLTRMP